MIRAGLLFALSTITLLTAGNAVRADGPTASTAAVSSPDGPSTGLPLAAAKEVNPPVDPAHTSAIPPIVIGFVGGFLRHDDAVHSTVILARNLQRDYAGAVHVETFENRRVNDARKTILHLLAEGHPNGPTIEEKRSARIVLYGHSWGGSAAVVLARALRADGIPVLLTVQVDSVAKLGHDDAIIPENVGHAANFFQNNGFPRGQQRIRAADANRTQIVGNFRFDYAAEPVSCPEYPWMARVFMKPHIEIECDPAVWHKVEDLIRAELPPATPTAASSTAASAKTGSQ